MAALPFDQTDREQWQKLRSNERCERCGHRGYCMYTSRKVYCMFDPDGAHHSGFDKAGAPYYLHWRTGETPPTPLRVVRPDERPDWTKPSPITCRKLYTAIADRYARTPTPKAASEADRRRFGNYTHAAGQVGEYFYLDPTDVLRWLHAEGWRQDAIAAGILNPDGSLSKALKGRKVYAWRRQGQVYDLRGRAYEDGDEPKVLSLRGSREERGCEAIFYHHDQILDAADGGHLRLAGGHEKADALLAAGYSAVGTNEGQVSDAMLAELVNACVGLVTIHVDGEDPKPRADGTTPPISEGQRLALALAERLEAAGIAVRLAEPEREPGSPKLDADTLLRDGGPEAVRACDRASVPLAVYRRRLGVAPTVEEGASVEELRRQVDTLREQVERERREKAEVIALNRSIRHTLANAALKQEGRAAIGLALELWDRRSRPETESVVDMEEGVRYFRYYNDSAGRYVGMSGDAVGKSKARLESWGLLKSTTKTVPTVDPESRQPGWKRESYLHVDAASIPDWLEQVATFTPTEAQAEQVGKRKWGRQPRCEQHPDAGVIVTTTTTCAECGKVLEETVTRQDAEGNVVETRATPSKPRVTVYPSTGRIKVGDTTRDGGKPQDAAYKVTSTEGVSFPADDADEWEEIAL